MSKGSVLAILVILLFGTSIARAEDIVVNPPKNANVRAEPGRIYFKWGKPSPWYDKARSYMRVCLEGYSFDSGFATGAYMGCKATTTYTSFGINSTRVEDYVKGKCGMAPYDPANKSKGIRCLPGDYPLKWEISHCVGPGNTFIPTYASCETVGGTVTLSYLTSENSAPPAQATPTPRPSASSCDGGFWKLQPCVDSCPRRECQKKDGCGSKWYCKP